MSMGSIAVDAYIRVSRVNGREGDSFLSPELQRDAIERLAKREGLRVIEWFEELDASGGDASRPLWNKAIGRVEKGKTEGLAVWNLSRFSRSLKDAMMTLERIEAAGGSLYSASEAYDNSPTGRMTRQVLFAISEMERERAKDGFRAAVTSAIERGIHVSRKIPFGYLRGEDRRYYPDPETAPHLVALFERRAKGVSWTELTRWSAAQGFPMSREGLRSRLMNSTYLGWAHAGEIVNKAAHEPLVSKRLFDAVQAMRRKSSRNGTWQARTLLNGLVTCAGCGRKMSVFNSAYKSPVTGKLEKEPSYYCHGISADGECPDRAFIRASSLDNYVEERVLRYLELLPARHRERGNDVSARLERAERELASAEDDLKEFAKDTKARRTLGAKRWNETLEEYVTVVNVATVEVETIRAEEGGDDVDVPVSQMWAEWTLESKREFLGRMLESVTITNAKRKRNIPMSQRATVKVVGSKSGGWLRIYGEDQDHWAAEGIKMAPDDDLDRKAHPARLTAPN